MVRLHRWASLIVIAVAPAALAAQAKVGFTPFFGYYSPLGKVADGENCGTGCTFSLKQKTAVLFGGRLGISVAKRVTIEASVGITPSRVEVAASGLGSADTSASVMLASGRVLIGVGPSVPSVSWHAILGAGIIAHGGDFYSDSVCGCTGKTDFGTVVGFGGTFKIGPTLGLRIDLEDNLFTAQFTDTASGQDTQSRFQNDIGITVGLAINFAGH